MDYTSMTKKNILITGGNSRFANLLKKVFLEKIFFTSTVNS